jgi:hypothetical protein
MIIEIEPLFAAILFALIFLFGTRINLLKIKHHRSLLSFAAGVAIAYVFVHLLPELSRASDVFIATSKIKSELLTSYHVYIAAMIGFIVFFGLDYMTKRSPKDELQNTKPAIFSTHIIGFAVYVWLITYLMMRGITEEPISITLYVIAMGLHFCSMEHELYHEHATIYMRYGRYILAIAALLGWAIGFFIELPKPIIITLLGVLSGGIIVNSMVTELPRDRTGKFLPFLFGGVFYSILLLLL